MNASYSADDTFEMSPELYIAPTVMSRMKIFSDEIVKYGESYSLNCNDGSIASAFMDDLDKDTFDIR